MNNLVPICYLCDSNSLTNVLSILEPIDPQNTLKHETLFFNKFQKFLPSGVPQVNQRTIKYYKKLEHHSTYLYNDIISRERKPTLLEKQIIAYIKEYNTTLTKSQIANHFGIDPSEIAHIIRKFSLPWKNITHGKSRVEFDYTTDDTIIKFLEEKGPQILYKEIALRFNVSKYRISKILQKIQFNK